MITEINDSNDMLAAFVDNYKRLVTGKIKPEMAREVSNSLGKGVAVVKLQLLEKMRLGDKAPIAWLAERQYAPKLAEEELSLLATSQEKIEYAQRRLIKKAKAGK